jgi:uncharacterized protein (TIGR03067 family)
LRAKVITRAKREKPTTHVPAVQPAPESEWSDVRPVLDEEVIRLPARYQATFVLFYFDGKSIAEVARQLGCPRGTVLSRLAWARDRLRSRLIRRGLSLTSATMALFLSKDLVSAAMPASAVTSAVQAAVADGTGQLTVASVVSERAVELSQAALESTLTPKLVVLAVATLAVTVIEFDAVALNLHAPAPVPTPLQERTSAAILGKTQPVAPEYAKLQGAWRCIAVEQNAKATRFSRQDADSDITFAIEGDRLCVTGRGPGPVFAFKLDPKSTPKRIDLTLTTQHLAPLEGIFFLEGQTGIYSLDGDTLKICYGLPDRPRPSQFATKLGDPYVLLVLKRAKP